MTVTRIAVDIWGDPDCVTPTSQALQRRRRTESGAPAATTRESWQTISVRVPSLVDGPQANVLADILMTQVDQLMSSASASTSDTGQGQSSTLQSHEPSPHQEASLLEVSSLRLQKLVMTPEGIDGLLLFLAIHAHTITRVSFLQLIPIHTKELDQTHPDSEDHIPPVRTNEWEDGDTHGGGYDLTMHLISGVAQAHTFSPLEKLEFSHLTLPACLWQHWRMHSHLAMLKLDHCTMDDASMVSCCEQLQHCWPSLQDLYVVLIHTQLSSLGVAAADKILAALGAGTNGNSQLTSLRWVHRYPNSASILPTTTYATTELGDTPSNKFPVAGLRELVVSQHATLQQLVLEGCVWNDHEIGQLCSILMELRQLVNVKLRNMQLTDAHAQTICRALYHAQAPIANMDWSGNRISRTGLQSILELIATTLKPTIQSLYLNANQLNRECFNILIDFLQMHQLADIDLRMEHNPFGAERMAPLLALALWEAERERDKVLQTLQEQADWNAAASPSAVDQQLQERRHNQDTQSQLLKLEQENSRLKDELETVIRAFSLVGAKQSLEEQRKLLDRIGRLEDFVFSSKTGSRGDVSRQSSGRSSRQSSSRDLGSRQGSHQDLVSSRQGSSRDLGARQGSSRDLGASGNWHATHSPDVLSTPVSTRRPAAPNLMETPRGDRRPALPKQSKSPNSSSNNLSVVGNVRSRRPPSAAKSADSSLLLRMQRSGSSRRMEAIMGDDPNGDRARLGNRRPTVVRSVSANLSITLEDESSQADVLTSRSTHDAAASNASGLRHGPSDSAGRRSNGAVGGKLHQSYSGFTAASTWETDTDRVHKSYSGFSSTWELDDVKETPYEDTE